MISDEALYYSLAFVIHSIYGTVYRARIGSIDDDRVASVKSRFHALALHFNSE